MNARIRIGLYAFSAIMLAACTNKLAESPLSSTTSNATSTATTLDDYKRGLAQRIVAVNSSAVYVGRPQALLRAVIVVKYFVSADGQLLRADILRSNRDRNAEATALATLRRAAPFPKPDSRLLRRGEVEVAESWLFNDDGRFQLRSIAERQMDE
ncbi:protein TonB [Collimonas sp. OK242]|jgi:protein TonB|uniref:energy transducer TonB family protein n=1 Tax=Collimonas sp. OK242 TaxID=1798195 RepID=UPI00089524BE|nr:protein TonB [Collimonas sp. OK242]